MNGNRLLVRAGLCIALLGACAPATRAQMPARTPPTAQECRTAANKAGSSPNSEAYRWAMTQGRLAECGSVGAEAIATNLRSAHTVADSLILQSLLLSAATNRHPAILEAALDIVADGAARLQVRVMALEVVLRQHDVQSAFGGSRADLFTVRVGRLCRLTFVEHASYTSSEPLRADYRAHVAAVLARVAADTREPPVLRDLAACVGRAVQRG